MLSAPRPGGAPPPKDAFLNDFVAERAEDAKKLLASLGEVPKKLPDCLRRRARSYKSFHWPRRASRAAAARGTPLVLKKRPVRRRPLLPPADSPGAGALLRAAGAAEGGEVRVRKHWRRPALLAAARCWSATAGIAAVTTGQWLETHVWHAKRFAMESIWGFRLAARNTAMGRRALYRAVSHHTAMHDRSYLQVFELSGEPSAVASALESCGIPRALLLSPSARRGSHRAAATLRSPAGGAAVAPVLLLWRAAAPDAAASTAGGERLWLWVHPSAASGAEEALGRAVAGLAGGCSLRRLEGLVFLEFFGPTALCTLARVLPPAACRGAGAALWRELAALAPGVRWSLPHGAVLALDVSVEALRPCATPQLQRSEDDGCPQVPPAWTLRWPADVSWSSDLWSIAQKEWPVTVPVLLVLRRGAVGDHTAGVDVLLPPRSQAKQVWLRGQFGGARTMGFRDRRALLAEGGVPDFPFDWPDTAAGEATASSEAAESLERYRRRPPAKRVNFKVLGVVCPHAIDWRLALPSTGAGAASSELAAQRLLRLSVVALAKRPSLPAGSLLPVVVHSCGRGTPRPLCQLCELSGEDLRRAAEGPGPGPPLDRRRLHLRRGQCRLAIRPAYRGKTSKSRSPCTRDSSETA